MGMMSPFLSEQIERFGEISESDRWRTEPADAERARDIAELAATAIFLLDRLETAAAREQPARPAWDVAAARRFAPLFCDWYAHASTVLKLIKESHSRGQAVEGASEFIHRFNAAKLLAVDMDHTVARVRVMTV